MLGEVLMREVGSICGYMIELIERTERYRQGELYFIQFVTPSVEGCMVFTRIELVGYHFMKHADVFFYLTPRFVRGTMQEGTFLFSFRKRPERLRSCQANAFTKFYPLVHEYP